MVSNDEALEIMIIHISYNGAVFVSIVSHEKLTRMSLTRSVDYYQREHCMTTLLSLTRGVQRPTSIFISTYYICQLQFVYYLDTCQDIENFFDILLRFFFKAYFYGLLVSFFQMRK